MKVHNNKKHQCHGKALVQVFHIYKTLSGTFVNAHTHKYTHMRVSIVYSITHIFGLSVGHI